METVALHFKSVCAGCSSGGISKSGRWSGSGSGSGSGIGSWSLPTDVPRAVKVTDGARAGAGDRCGCGYGYGKVPFRGPDERLQLPF